MFKYFFNIVYAPILRSVLKSARPDSHANKIALHIITTAHNKETGTGDNLISQIIICKGSFRTANDVWSIDRTNL